MNPFATQVQDSSSGKDIDLLLRIGLLATGLIALVLAATHVVTYHEKSKGIALVLVGLLAIGATFVLGSAGKRRSSRWIGAIAVVPLCLWVVVIAYTHRITMWDEGAYLLSGMALRGYHVPYAAHRAPVTHFICAVFVGWDRFLNPCLLVILFATTYVWVRRLLGSVAAAVSIFILVCQNLILESSVDITSELPGALLVLAGFFTLARTRFWPAAVCFTLAVFTRWNLAPIWGIVAVGVLLHFGWRQAAKFVAVALAVFGAWYLFTAHMGVPPLEAVYRGNFLPAAAWTADPTQRPDFLRRVGFYAPACFFITPVMLFVLLASPVQNLRKQLTPEQWVILVLFPISALVYLFTMLTIGGLFPRFSTPIIPMAVVTLLVWLRTFAGDRSWPERYRLRLLIVFVFVACAFGLWPMNALIQVIHKYETPLFFSRELRSSLMALDGRVSVNAVPLAPLMMSNGYPAMTEIRHIIHFPSARRDSTSSILLDTDPRESVRRLAQVCRSGDLLLVPLNYVSELNGAAVMLSDSHWAIVRNP